MKLFIITASAALALSITMLTVEITVFLTSVLDRSTMGPTMCFLLGNSLTFFIPESVRIRFM